MTREIRFICFLMIAAIGIADVLSDSAEDSLVMVNMVFRHGDRTPITDLGRLMPAAFRANLTFYPYGSGQLTNRGRQRAYRLGEILRERYDDFLGDIYLQKDIKARSTSIIRSKMTLLLVLAALYPPKSEQVWNKHLDWQPINTISLPVDTDGLLLPLSCPVYNDTLNKLYESKEIKELLSTYDDLAKGMTELSGIEVQDVWNLYKLYHTLDALSCMDIPLSSWTEEVFPYGRLRDASILQYNLLSYTPELNRNNGGIFLNRVINDMQKLIKGTSHVPKLNLYAAHDITVVAVLHALGVYDGEMPEYTSGVIMELHVKNGKYYVKALFHQGIPEETVELIIPGCEVFCPLDRFVELRKDALPLKDELVCDTPEPEEF